MPLEEDKVISFQKLLAEPLIATMHADFEAGIQFVEFFQKYGLEEVDDNTEEEDTQGNTQKKLSFKMVTFCYRQGDQKYSVQVPLLSLIPLPLLQIDTAEFEFNIRIFTEVANPNQPSYNPEKSGTNDKSSQSEYGKYEGMKARLAPTTVKGEDGKPIQSVDSNMKVTVKMKQADLPVGMIRLMRVFENSTNIIPDNKPIKKQGQIKDSEREEKVETAT
ncbi:MAG: DUF2589 domain-containing protein [Nostoc sp. ChiSLP02]|nr:DUF2589 domain-containing protein [Nostoc sp. DedSLP05]MDZ8103225.1 DUF2589 domain-containing protein [Nostoc sp. DedSLP01]MDZ8188024.1 DUF2589 domain-containing protein [Nostoc sp. ChiSLP02]